MVFPTRASRVLQGGPVQHLSSPPLAQRAVAAIREAIGGRERAVLHEPTFQGREWQYVKECIDSGWVSTAGTQIKAFEDALAACTGARHAIAVVNGTAALHLCLIAAGVRRDDEVIAPTLSFVATANAVTYCGAVPHLADAEAATLGMAAQPLRAHLRAIAERVAGETRNRATGRRIRALVTMHTFGHPVDLDGLRQVAEEFGLVLVEDAAEALGSRYHGRHVGTHGLLSALSFNGNKIVTTGGGGAVLCNDDEVARRVRHLSTTARLARGWSFDHDQIGYNYRMPNLNAALGRAQLERLPEMVAAKRALALSYERAFEAVPELDFVREPPGCESIYWLNAVLLSPQLAVERDAILAATNAAGLETRPAWTLMHRLPAFLDCPRMALPVAESIEARLINLPSSPFLAERPRVRE
jgi:perosamine synthetase